MLQTRLKRHVHIPTGVLCVARRRNATGAAACRPCVVSMEPTRGFEPLTPALRVRCSGQLSYVGITPVSYRTMSQRCRRNHPVAVCDACAASRSDSRRVLAPSSPRQVTRRRLRTAVPRPSWGHRTFSARTCDPPASSRLKPRASSRPRHRRRSSAALPSGPAAHRWDADASCAAARFARDRSRPVPGSRPALSHRLRRARRAGSNRVGRRLCRTPWRATER